MSWTRQAPGGEFRAKLVLRDDPHGVDYAGDVAEDGQQDVDPEVFPDPHLQEHPEGREKYRDYEA